MFHFFFLASKRVRENHWQCKASKGPYYRSKIITRNEIRLCLLSAEHDISHRNMESIVSMFKCIATEDIGALNAAKAHSTIINMSLGRTKLRYCLIGGLSDHFRDNFVDQMRRSPVINFSFDSSTTKRLGLAKQLDLRVRYYDINSKIVQERLIDIVELVHETAQDLMVVFDELLTKFGLSWKHVYSIAHDDPNVNKCLIKMVKVKTAKPEIANAGFIDIGGEFSLSF